MKKFDEVKRNVSKFCEDHIFGITATAMVGAWIAYFVFVIREIRNLDNNITDCTDSLTYVLDPAKIAITVPDADHIDEAIKWIKENEVLNPLDYEEFQRIVDTFTELKNNKN